jgi:hypothetical protein
MSVDRAKILDKIKKCLALSKSANEHEAAAPLRKAQSLIRLHEIGESEIEGSKISEANASASAARRPALWETILAGSVADAFGCVRLFGPAASGKGSWCSIGAGCTPTVAQYALTVLLRKVTGARKAYSETTLRRCTQSRKTVRADMFCLAWVKTVDAQVARFARPEEAAISAYLKRQYSSMKELQLRHRVADKRVDEYLLRDFDAGQRAEAEVRLQHGVESSGLTSCSKAPIERQRTREHEQC